MCQALTRARPDLQGRASALCQATGLNLVTAAACSLVLRRYLSALSVGSDATSSGPVVCHGAVGNASYEVRDTGQQYVGRAMCWYLEHEATGEGTPASGITTPEPVPTPNAQ
jgi:hypothetical protein